MYKKYILLSLVFLFTSVNAYELNLVVDNESKKYLSAIKKETKALFSSSTKINFKTTICEGNCSSYLNSSTKKLLLLNKGKKYPKTKNNYIISYNYISSVYDENTFIRTAALGIYEFLKENRVKTIYIKNRVLINNTSKNIDFHKEEAYSLKKVFSLALQNNLQIKQNKNQSLLSNLGIDESKSAYKPKVDIFANYMQIDADRAQYSNGQNSQGTVDAGLKLSQLIYSNKVIENIKISKLLAKSSKDEVSALNDEIMYKAAVLYLNIIKAKKYEQIIKIKYDFIRQNLQFAKQRVDIGVKDRSDVYRWESELANVQIDLANAKKDLNSLNIELSNLLLINKSIPVIEYGMNSKLFKLLQKDAIKYIGDKRIQELFSQDIVHTHSRLKQLSTLIIAKQKELGINKDSRFLPTVAFEGSAKRILKRYGEGSSALRPWDDKEYQAVINLNLPLYEGGVKSVRIQKSEIELINLKLEYKNTKNLIIENVRKNYESLHRSYEKIAFANVALGSSKKNFELIQDKYKNGKENIISLLDAQNSYIVSKLNLNISIVEYLEDLSSIYFFSGKIEILVDDNKKEEVENRILKELKGFEK